MSSKKLSLYILASGGSILGGYVAKTLGASPFGGWWFLGTSIGMVAGVYLWVKMGEWGQ